MSRYSLLISFVAGYLVSLKSIDLSKEYFFLHTKSLLIEQAFVEAVVDSPVQCSYLFCTNLTICDFTEESSAVFHKQGESLNYSWEYTSLDFQQFLWKMNSPLVISINSTQDLIQFNEYHTGFILFHDNFTLLDEFASTIKKYYHTPLYFGEITDPSLIKLEEISELPTLRLYGLDGIYKHSTSDRFLEFIDHYKCPILLPYADSHWTSRCLQDKIVIVSLINKKRKGSWNMFGGQLKMYGEELKEEEKYIYQMMYVDTKIYSNIVEMYHIPIVPCMIILDNRVGEVYYLGEYNIKNRKMFFKLLEDVRERKLNLEEFTVDKIIFTKYFTVWQIFPLLFLLAGLCIVVYVCIRSTFSSKIKTS